MAANSSDKLLLAAAVLVAAGSAAVFGTLAWRSASAAREPVPAVELAGEPYQPSVKPAPPVKTETWSAPVAQSRGREWLYDAFTPPEIFYNARTRQFTVKPPTSLVEPEAVEEAFGLELVAVRPEPFRLQLIGFIGEEGNWRGTFENLRTGEVFLATSGQSLPKLGLTIRSFDVRPQPVALPQSMTTRQRVATAIVRDAQTGRDVLLTHRDRTFTGTVSAFVAAPGETATREVRPGDVFKLGAATYRIGKIQLAPPQIEVTKESPTVPKPDTRTLGPREFEDVEKPEGGRIGP